MEYNENTGTYELIQDDIIHYMTLEELVEVLEFECDSGVNYAD